METKQHIRYIILYLVSLLVVVIIIYNQIIQGTIPSWIKNNNLLSLCVLTGCIGGLLYAFRAIYTHRCKLDDWENRYIVWYYIRPIISMITGGVSWLLLKAGIILLNADNGQNESAMVLNQIDYGYLAFALFAGYNVEHFLEKVEDIMQSVWGINKSDTNKSDSSSK